MGEGSHRAENQHVGAATSRSSPGLWPPSALVRADFVHLLGFLSQGLVR